MSERLKPLLPFEAYEGISWSRAIVTVLRWWPIVMIMGARLFRRGRIAPNGQNLTIFAAGCGIATVAMFFWTRKERSEALEKLYSSLGSELVAPPDSLERYYLPCEQTVGFMRFIGVILVGPGGFRFVAQRAQKKKEEKPQSVLSPAEPPASGRALFYDELRVLGSLHDVSVSLEPRSWWRSRGFANAKQRVKITCEPYTTFFWIPYPEEAVSELTRVVQELRDAAPPALH